MADVTGPISSLPNSRHAVPEGTMCDDHPDRPAVVRIQGETDSFGSEMHDMCQECFDAENEWQNSDEAREWRTGTCEWCKGHATDLREARDYDEGMYGRVYRVCGPCIKRVNDEAAAELAAYDDWDDYHDHDDEDCWNCGGDGYVSDCFDGMCVDAESGCDDCTRRCDVCNTLRKAEGRS